MTSPKTLPAKCTHRQIPVAYLKEDSDTHFFVDLLIDWLENDCKNSTP